MLNLSRRLSQPWSVSGYRITPVPNGSNVYDMRLGEEISIKKFNTYMLQEHQISFRPQDKTGIVKFKVNQTLLTRELDEIIQAFKSGTERARG